MTPDTIRARLAFLREAERLKDRCAAATSSSGRAESTAEHSWRLCLMALVFADALPGIDTPEAASVVHDPARRCTATFPRSNKPRTPTKARKNATTC